MDSLDHLFRRESGRMVSVLTGIFGVHNLGLAEDSVQEAFVRAVEVWKYRGVPENPSAWLMSVAKRCALDVLRRERTARKYAPEFGLLLESEWTLAPVVEAQFEDGAIKDGMLRMMFSCCAPALSDEAQIGLILHVLCGFSVTEVAAAFVASHAAIEKRLTRAKQGLAASSGLFDVKDRAGFVERLPAVQRALYLLFNEGYHGASAQAVIRSELCREAMRLTALLADHPFGRVPSTDALAALMCLHAARLPGRVNAAGNLTLFHDQDRSSWDQQLIAEGLALLDRSAAGSEMSVYHLEAAIAAAHASARDAAATNWAEIVSLYDALLQLRPSPIISLGRAVAVGESQGPAAGLAALEAIDGGERLAKYPFFFAARGTLERRSGRFAAAEEGFRTAAELARNEGERRFFEEQLAACRSDRTG